MWGCFSPSELVMAAVPNLIRLSCWQDVHFDAFDCVAPAELGSFGTLRTFSDLFMLKGHSAYRQKPTSVDSALACNSAQLTWRSSLTWANRPRSFRGGKSTGAASWRGPWCSAIEVPWYYVLFYASSCIHEVPPNFNCSLNTKKLILPICIFHCSVPLLECICAISLTASVRVERCFFGSMCTRYSLCCDLLFLSSIKLGAWVHTSFAFTPLQIC